MILKKPYAFFIKMFKPIHLVLSVLVGYLFYLNNNILMFLNEYIYSAESLASQQIIENLLNKFLYIIPIILVVFFFLLIGIMYKKKKPILFYFVGIFVFIAVLVINIYTVNFLDVLTENVVSVKMIKLIHDLVLINIVLECCSFILLFIRGLGLDFKKFNFSSDISNFDISETDKEEFEVNISIDFDERKRKRKHKYRNFKYLYIENKFLINLVIIIFVSLVVFFGIFFAIKKTQVNKEGVYYNTDTFIFKVNNTTILNTDYKGDKITDNYLIIVNANIKSKYFKKSLYLNDFSLKIGNTIFKPTKKYFNFLLDLGNFYTEQPLDTEYNDYLFVYEIPEKYIESDMIFRYNNKGNFIEILLNPNTLTNSEISKEINIKEKLEFDSPLNDVGFKINSYELSDKFLIDYKYCIKENDCISSKEYLKPSINENYDKTILKLNVEYNSHSNLDIDTFYKLLSKFGTVSYKKGDTWYNIYKFEEILSKRVNTKNDIYIGLNSDILNSESIKIIFDIRGIRYEYMLKQVSK